MNLVFGWFLIIINILGNITVFAKISHVIVELNFIKIGLIFEAEKLIVFSFVLEEDVSEPLLESGKFFNSGYFTELLNVFDFTFVFVFHKVKFEFYYCCLL